MNGTHPEDIRYVILLTRADNDCRDMGIIRAHVEYLRELDRRGQLVLCGPFADAPGGMVIIKASSRGEAEAIAAADPFVISGIRSFEVRTWELSHEGNGHMGMVELEQ